MDSRWNRTLRAALYGAGLFSGVFFVTTKSEWAMSWATTGSYAYGDLYRYAKIKRFKPSEPLPFTGSREDSFTRGRPALGESAVYLVGDSFGFTCFENTQYAANVERQLAAPVFTVNNNSHGDAHDRPVSILKESRLTPNLKERRVLVLEMAERLIPGYFADDNVLEPLPLDQDGSPPRRHRGWLGTVKHAALVDTEPHHEILMRHCFLWAPAMEAWSSWLFASFGSMAREIPLYSVDPPFLFYEAEVETFRARFADEQIMDIASRAARLRQRLRDQYNCELLFVPVPNKISIYSGLATPESYNDFLPRLCSELNARGVPTVDLLTRFHQEKELLYWPSDTHWNARGINIAVDETVRAWPIPLSERPEK